MSLITDLTSTTNPYAAGSTPTWKGTLTDASGAAVGLGALTSLVLSITDDPTGGIINNVSDINILNADRGTVDVNGNVTIYLEAGDTALFVATDTYETRSMSIKFTYPGPSGQQEVGYHRVRFSIVPVPGV